MRLPSECYQMQKTIEPHLPHLSQPQLTGLALWVCGAILAGSACQNAVASALSPLEQLVQPAPAPQGVALRRRRPRDSLPDRLDVTLCFAPLLRWVLCWWRSGGLALAIDPTLKGDQTTAIVIRWYTAVAPSPWPGTSGTRPARLLDGPHRGTAASLGPSGSREYDRHRALRPGHCQSQAVAADTGSRLASRYALPKEHHFLR